MRTAVAALIPGSGLTTAVCAGLEVSRASVHRHRTALLAPPRAPKPRPPVARALPENERDQVLAHLRTARFADQTPAPESGPRVWPRSMPPCRVKASICVGSARCTSILAAHGEVAERRRLRRHRGLAKARTAGRRAQPGVVLGVRRGLASPGSNCPGDSLKRRTPN